MNWKTGEDLPIHRPRECFHGITSTYQSADIVEKCIDNLVPRGGKRPKAIAISIEDYLSRVAMLSRKIKGVRHRKSCWDRIVQQHLREFDKIVDKSAGEDIEAQDVKMVYTYSLRDIRLENEFEVLIYSVRTSLDILTRVISAFLSGRTQLHSHSALQKNLNVIQDWGGLAGIVNEACREWIDDLTKRRDAATHYVALTAMSCLTVQDGGNNATKVQTTRVSIPKEPPKYVSVWIDDIPVLGGTSHSSTKVTQADESNIEAHGIFDGRGNLLVQRNHNLPELPEMIDGIEYSDNLMRNYERYIVEVGIELKRRIC